MLPGLNWVWYKRCQMCRARYCHRCATHYVRQRADVPSRRRAQVHEVGHSLLAKAELGDAATTEAAAEAFADYVLRPRASGSSGSSWVTDTLRRWGPPYWKETVAALRTGVTVDGTPHRCLVCGHRWVEFRLTGLPSEGRAFGN
jgi:hypothetical protein